MPTSCRHRSTTAGDAATLTPSASSTSALPHRLDTDRLPCLATRTPQAATTSAAAVEMLKVPGTIAAGAARVEHVARRRRQRHRLRPHRPRKPDELRGPLAFHRQADQQPGNLRRRRLAAHDHGHRRGGLVGREVFAASELLDQRTEHHSQLEKVPQDAAALVREDRLGVKLHAVQRPAAMAQPMTSPSSFERAVTSSSAGQPSSATTSE